MESCADIPKGLIWYPDSEPGITRKKAGRGFTYFAADGTRIERGEQRARIEALAVPPAYADVWISPRTNGHLLATGYDDRSRKQYRYHPDYSTFRSETKFSELPLFGSMLPRIRRRVRDALTGNADSQEFAIAAALRLIDRASLRVGTPDYAEENDSYGATTLRSRHLKLTGDTIGLDFKAKGGKRVRKQIKDKTLLRALEHMDDLPGGSVMKWQDDDGNNKVLVPEQVNAWLRDVTGEGGLTAKTFRTWNGSVAALDAAMRAEGDVTIKLMADAAAEVLHNTPTIARNSYIHPDVIALTDTPVPNVPEGPNGLRQSERALLALIGAG